MIRAKVALPEKRKGICLVFFLNLQTKAIFYINYYEP